MASAVSAFAYTEVDGDDVTETSRPVAILVEP